MCVSKWADIFTDRQLHFSKIVKKWGSCRNQKSVLNRPYMHQLRLVASEWNRCNPMHIRSFRCRILIRFVFFTILKMEMSVGRDVRRSRHLINNVAIDALSNIAKIKTRPWLGSITDFNDFGVVQKVTLKDTKIVETPKNVHGIFLIFFDVG